MAQEVGKLIYKSEVIGGTSKAGKPWQKIEFVIQVKGVKYPRKVKFDSLQQSVIGFVNDTSMDTDLRVEYSVESREYNGKWYTNANAFSVETYREDNPMLDHKGVAVADAFYGKNEKDNSFEPQEDDLPF